MAEEIDLPTWLRRKPELEFIHCRAEGGVGVLFLSHCVCLRQTFTWIPRQQL